MKIQKHLAVLFAGFCFIVVAAWAGVTTDYDHHANSSHYKTYSWGKIQTANGLWDDRVKDAVAGQLAAKGWTEVPSGGEVVVAARDGLRDHHWRNTRSDGVGGRR